MQRYDFYTLKEVRSKKYLQTQMDHSVQNWQNSQNLEVSKLMEIVLVFLR